LVVTGRERLAGAILLITLAIGIGSKVLDRGHGRDFVSETTGGGMPDQVEQAKTDFRRIEINTASLDELTALPGIGPKKAQAIAAWREQRGPFENVEQLTSVKGVGEKTLASIRVYVYVKDRSPGKR
jgi:competence protein ComEA